MGLRILIVDDEPQIREALDAHLARLGHDVVQAPDGKAAIRELEQEPFDLVISDVLMPEQDGLEVLLFTRKHCPDTRVLAISAPGNELFLRSAKGLGAWRVLSKPFALEEITQAIGQLPQAQAQPRSAC